MDGEHTTSPVDTHPAPRRLIYRRRHRLSGRRAYAAVLREGMRKPRGPLVVVGLPNMIDDVRLGLSVSRRVGIAVTRNTIKRRLREAFRTLRPTMPAGYDLVVIVRPHEPATLDEYREWLRTAWSAVDRVWEKWSVRAPRGSDGPLSMKKDMPISPQRLRQKTISDGDPFSTWDLIPFPGADPIPLAGIREPGWLSRIEIAIKKAIDRVGETPENLQSEDLAKDGGSIRDGAADAGAPRETKAEPDTHDTNAPPDASTGDP